MNTWNLRRKFLKDFKEAILPIFKAYYLSSYWDNRIVQYKSIEKWESVEAEAKHWETKGKIIAFIELNKLIFSKSGSSSNGFLRLTKRLMMP